jgi:hypothetical protein
VITLAGYGLKYTSNLSPDMLYDYVDAIKFWRKQLVLHSTKDTTASKNTDELHHGSLGSGLDE